MTWGIEKHLPLLHQTTESSEIVIGPGGNVSDKTKNLIIIKGSGSDLDSLTREQMVVCSRVKLRRDYKIFTPAYLEDVPDAIREERYEKVRLASRVEQGDNIPLPSVELIVHHLMPQKYVLHTHPRALTALCSLEDSPNQITRLLGNNHKYMPFIVPGILLGIEAEKLIKEHVEEHGEAPPMIDQGNHNMFFGGNNFKQLVETHNQAVATVYRAIQSGITAKGLDKAPFGTSKYQPRDDFISPKKLMGLLYEAIFQEELTDPVFRENMNLEPNLIVDRLLCNATGNAGTIYFSRQGIMQQYACSQFAEDNHDVLTWKSPDHIVSGEAYTDYLHLSDPTDVSACKKDIKEQVKPHKTIKPGYTQYARNYVIPGYGVATVGGFLDKDAANPEIRARLAMQFAHDACLVTQYQSALGIGTNLDKKIATEWIPFWRVEVGRQEQIMKNAAK